MITYHLHINLVKISKPCAENIKISIFNVIDIRLLFSTIFSEGNKRDLLLHASSNSIWVLSTSHSLLSPVVEVPKDYLTTKITSEVSTLCI